MDDLDALLDDALDTMTAQDEVMEKEKRAHEASAQSILNEAVAAAGGGSGAMGGPMAGMDADMLQALGGLMSILQKGPDAMENASEEEMADITSQLQRTLDQLKNHPDLSSEDAGQLGDMKSMMEKLRDLEKGQGSEGTGDAAGNGAEALPEEEFTARREELTRMLEAMSASGGLMGGAGSGGPNLPPFPFSGPSGGTSGVSSSSAVSASSANAAGVPLPPLPTDANGMPMSEDEACRQVFEMTLGILQERDIEQPFAKLKTAYEPWLALNTDKLPANERARFENQYRVASEMCEFFANERVSEVLKEGGPASSEQRAAILERFGTLMAELHSYGEVPSDLFPENDAGAGSREA